MSPSNFDLTSYARRISAELDTVHAPHHAGWDISITYAKSLSRLLKNREPEVLSISVPVDHRLYLLRRRSVKDPVVATVIHNYNSNPIVQTLTLDEWLGHMKVALRIAAGNGAGVTGAMRRIAL